MKRIYKYFGYLWHLTEGFHRVAALRTILGVFRVGIVLTFIWLSKTAIDVATGSYQTVNPASHAGAGVPFGSLTAMFAVMVVCLLLDVTLSQCARYMESRATMRLNIRLNRRLFNVLMTLPLVNGQQGFHSGDMLNRLTLDVRTIANFALTQLPTMIVMAAQLIGAFIFLARLNPYLALAPLVIMPVCLFAGKMYFRRHRRLIAMIREGESDMHVAIQEGLKHRIVVRTLECIEEIDRRLVRIQQRLDDTNRQQTRLSIVNGATVRIGFVLGYLTAFGWSLFSLEAGVITFGTMSAFIQLVSRIQNPIANITGYLPAFLATSVALDRLNEIDLRMPREEKQGGCIPIPRAGVRVSDLTFRYDDGTENILTSFSHDFLPGSRTMIVGSTGAGKTTLIKLLLGLLQPASGSVEIYSEEGEGRREKVSPSTLCNFVYVPQGNSLLQGTIRDNLRLAAPHATDEELAAALHTAVADFVFELPQGLDTSCDEAGGGLSEGQAQRIAIARALLRPGSILLLDEFNSALDTDTAATLMERLAAGSTDSTIIIIAHHRSVIAPYMQEIISIRN